ncbi:hypothetical protein FHS31_001499 [Sphingomonas vulcanisoli]|uniref:Uncharacterized protein n=1 Tax=Sphingomonas vulcanisoli TaxID=1658060 RepID=A0ABX0TT15_9SPHN|nr:hypothetical protein [Sphingomonas vulcanisoli]
MELASLATTPNPSSEEEGLSGPHPFGPHSASHFSHASIC